MLHHFTHLLHLFGLMSFNLWDFEELSEVVETSQLRAVYLQQDFSQRAYHVEGTILFPGVTELISENLVAEAHSLLQHLNRRRRTYWTIV